MRLRNRQPNSGTKSTWSTWIAKKLPPVAEKSVVSIKDQRECRLIVDVVVATNSTHTKVSVGVATNSTNTEVVYIY